MRWLDRGDHKGGHVSGVFDDEEVTEEMIRPWTAVRSARGKFIHMCWNGEDTMCGVRLRTLIPMPDCEIDCLECHNALTFN